jgi:AcrR family transcriptional regulator
MQKTTKGALTRQFIVTEARRVFNENGISLTLGELASKMGVTIGRITNHFRTKDHLFIGLSDDYENHFNELMKSFSWNGEVNLTKLAELIKGIMLLQYEHRCLMLFVCATGLNQDLLINQVSARWSHNSSRFSNLITGLVVSKIMEKRVLEKENLEVLKFQHINLLTTWLVSNTIYDKHHSLNKNMNKYLKGILLTFHPHLTTKGKNELKRIIKISL